MLSLVLNQNDINLHTKFMYNYLIKKKIAYPTAADLSVSTGQVGDEISVVCSNDDNEEISRLFTGERE